MMTDEQKDRMGFLQYVRSCRLILTPEERQELKELEEQVE